MTEASELTREGWGKHEKGEDADAPLTREEETLRGVKDAEAVEAGRSGTGGRQLETGGKLALGMGDGVREALVGLKGAEAGSVVVLVCLLAPSLFSILCVACQTSLHTEISAKNVRERNRE